MNRDLSNIAKSLHSADSTAKAAWRKCSLEEIMLIWRLYKGGIWDTKRIREITGLNIHGKTMQSIAEGVEHVLNGPLLLQQPVRCSRCGASVIVVPCPRCAMPIHHAGRYRDIPPSG